MYYEATQGIEIEVKPEYLPNDSQPELARFVFGYHITITNQGQTEVQLLSRHWIITDGEGVIHEVKGPGVVGENPNSSPERSTSTLASALSPRLQAICVALFRW